MVKKWITALIILSLLGATIAVAYILNHNQSSESGGICVIGENTCLSSYNLGWITLPLVGRIHLSWIAIGYFFLLAGLFTYLYLTGNKQVFKVSLALLVIGTLLIPYLAYLQISKLNGICIYCTSMYVVIIMSLVVSLYLKRSIP
ncbi:MAG: hypothetical protein F7C82_03775 [Desulfurococcales archaeon]|nr:hypothetical protein [Desulfurococcales archaeon]MCE4629378.1 hypothetical protein [Desulfurococcales archaeon]